MPELVDYKVSGWGKWDECAAPCNGENKTRHRLVVRPKSMGVEHVQHWHRRLSVTRSCDCGVTQFSRSTCSKDCRLGQQAALVEYLRTLGDSAVYPHLGETVCNNRTCPFMACRVGLSDLAFGELEAEVFRGRDDKLWYYEQQKCETTKWVIQK